MHIMEMLQTTQSTMKRKLTLTTVLAILASFVILLLSGCRNTTEDSNGDGDHQYVLVIDDLEAQTVTIEDFPIVGEGDNFFLFEVTDDEDMSTFWRVYTNHTTVGEALVELDLVQGEDSDLGFFVTEINGLVADFDHDGAFWAFYIDGDSAMAGIMDTEIEPGTIYRFVFTR